MKRVLLDVDGVSANFVQATLDTLADLGGPTLHHDTIQTWEIFSSLPEGWEPRLASHWRQAGWCSQISLYPGALEGVRSLQQQAEVVFVTTAMQQAPFWMWEREQWLQKHFDIPRSALIFADAKHLVRGDVFVDDKPSHVRDWSLANPEGQAVLWDQPYNRSASIPPNVLRTNSWSSLAELLR